MPVDATLFHRLRWRLLRNSLFLLWDHSLIRGLTIVLCSALIWSGLFALSWSGFHFLKSRNIPLDGLLMNQVFDLFFLVLTIFLLFSTGIIIYSSLFASPESAFLLSGPVREDKVFAYKFQAAVGFSSWAFVLLGSPILLAYGLEVSAPWYYYAALLAYFIGYVLIPGAIGAAITLVLVNFAPRRRKQLLTAVITSVALALLVRGIFWLREVSLNPLGSRAWFDTLLAELGNFSGRWLPYHWLARGLVASARAEVDGMAYNLALVWSNGLFLFVLVSWAAKKGFRRGFNLVATGGDLRRRYGGHWLDQALDRVLFFLHPQTRVLIVKDFRTFRRDPAQLWQIIILAGLAVIYFLNMRYFYQQDVGRPFQNGISLLTLAATSFWLCAYTGRFIFPLLSLEGRKFWILGLLPLDRQRLLWGKFAFSAAGCLALSSTLVLFSDLMLHMPWFVVVLHWVTAVVLSLGLSALSVGLGACLPNFRETDPSKIAVGFGGTLNLVTGLLFLLAVIGSMAGPAHFWLATHPDESATAPWWIWVGLSLGLLIGFTAIWLPLRAGARNLRRIEF